MDGSTEILAVNERASAWDDVLALEPASPLMLEADAVDRAFVAMGSFADLISPNFSGHSSGVAELARAAAKRCGVGEAGLNLALHDVRALAEALAVWYRSRTPAASTRTRTRA